METEEEDILQSLISAWVRGRETFFDEVSALTGTFLLVIISNDCIIAVQDASGLKACYFGEISKRIYISSHAQLVADITGLRTDPFIEKLVSSKMYNVGNRYLPGDRSPFEALRRLGANTYLELNGDCFDVHRFFPLAAPPKLDASEDVTAILESLAETLSRSIEAITMKWRRPAISMTGGVDSKTTLAAAAGLYEDLDFFSFASKPDEKLDADAAAEICMALGLDHILYTIPASDGLLPDYAIKKKIIDHNTGYFKNLADHEIRKIIFLEQQVTFDVEIKSWASEIARVFMERKYDVQFPAQLSPRHLSIFQTRYFGTPSLLRKTDEINEDFIANSQFDKASQYYEAADLYYWELRLGGWGSSGATAFDYSHEVTIPYNNRRFLETFLSLPREMRKTDQAHAAIMNLKQPKILAANIDVKNAYSRSYRRLIEKAYYLYRTFGYSIKQRSKTNRWLNK